MNTLKGAGQAFYGKAFGHTRTGSATALLIPLFLIFISSGAVAAHRLADSAFLKAKRETAKLTMEKNLEEIARIKRSAALSDEGWNKDTRRVERRPVSERVLEECARRFGDSRSRYRCEEIFYIALLHNGFPEDAFPDLSSLKMTEELKANIVAAAKRLLPEWGRGGNEKKPVILIGGFERPDTGRWILAPSLKHLSPVIRNAPLLEKFFQILLFANFYTGTGMENARKTWEKLRLTEMANLGRDSLGMYPGNTVF
jgi:hypothetical protein